MRVVLVIFLFFIYSGLFHFRCNWVRLNRFVSSSDDIFDVQFFFSLVPCTWLLFCSSKKMNGPWVSGTRRAELNFPLPSDETLPIPVISCHFHLPFYFYGAGFFWLFESPAFDCWYSSGLVKYTLHELAQNPGSSTALYNSCPLFICSFPDYSEIEEVSHLVWHGRGGSGVKASLWIVWYCISFQH